MPPMSWHKDEETRAIYERLGFFDGWGTVTEQLAAIAEREAREADCPVPRSVRDVRHSAVLPSIYAHSKREIS